MAASLLPCPPSSNNYRMGQLCLHMHPDQLQKSIMCLSVHIQSKACNRKLYMIPGGAISDRHVLRTSASAGSIELDSTHQGNEASFSVWGPNDPQGRSKKLLDCSRNPLEDTTDFEGQLQELFDEVKTMIKMGNENDAIDLLRANYEAVKEQMDSGARGIEQAATLDVIALGYIAIGDLKMVGSLLDVLDEVVDGLKDDELLLDSVLTHMGSMYSALGKFEDSMLAYRRSLEILEREYGNADEAIQLYINALQVLKDSKGMPLDDNVMEKMRIEVAELLHLVGRGKEGRKLLEECLFITEKYKGKEHPSLVTYLVNLATSFSCSKNFVEAERLLRRSLQIMLKTVGPNDQSITFPMLNLAVTLHNLNQHEEAEQVAVEVLRIREKAFGKESLPVGEALDCLVSIQSKLGKDDIELLELLKRVLAIQEKGFGSESEEVMQTLNKIVFYLDKMGMRDEKFPMQRRLSMLRTKYKHMVQY
ncbi:uncharacterized protein LOC114303718 isoform X4 [Camellia sinensis]|uniref:uncharacterized protein LOC114303718 isoform X4 n=1 Tax=Camellia sinensis TaxID=4442 RepID=UPI0010358C34|nr:uncharacterized protein LOC114303718 isoform X4 [Camellia sinensis]